MLQPFTRRILDNLYLYVHVIKTTYFKEQQIIYKNSISGNTRRRVSLYVKFEFVLSTNDDALISRNSYIANIYIIGVCVGIYSVADDSNCTGSTKKILSSKR